MFDTFYQKITERLQLDNRLEQIRSHCRRQNSRSERNPDRRILWDRRLRTFIPLENQHLYFSSPQILETAVLQFANLGQYTTQQTLFSLVDEHFGQLMDPSDLEWVKQKAFEFHSQVFSWENGAWHHQIQSNRLNAVKKLTDLAGFHNEWDTARFLARCGYHCPSSRLSYLEWLRFSGQPLPENSWFQWLGLLGEIADGQEDILICDQTLDLFFEMEFKGNLPDQEPTPATCLICPLMDNCSHFQKKIKIDLNAGLENLIRMDDTINLSITQLIPYLAGDRYTHSSTQEELLDSFPDLFHTLSPGIVANSEDEQFYLFLKALKLTADKLSLRPQPAKGTIFNKSDIIFQELKTEFEDLKQEAFYTLILDNKYRKIHFKLITRGILNRSIIHAREVFAPAIQLRAAAIILVHNHPSGDPQPSTQDIEITNSLTEAGDIIGIKVVDHVIIGHDSYFSFCDEGIL